MQSASPEMKSSLCLELSGHEAVVIGLRFLMCLSHSLKENAHNAAQELNKRYSNRDEITINGKKPQYQVPEATLDSRSPHPIGLYLTHDQQITVALY